MGQVAQGNENQPQRGVAILAQRFSAGKRGKHDQVPEGRPKFSHDLKSEPPSPPATNGFGRARLQPGHYDPHEPQAFSPLPASLSDQAVRRAADNGILLASEGTMNELADVLTRPKFDRYISLQDRREFLRLLGRVAEFVPIVYRVQQCRDPEDDKFLEVALNGKADLILTGDRALLALHPWRGIAILSPRNYLKS